MKIKKDFTLRSVMGQNIVLAEGNNSESFGKIITLNDTAAYLWRAIAGREFEVVDAAKLLVDKYGINPGQACEDASYIVSRLREKGLIEE